MQPPFAIQRHSLSTKRGSFKAAGGMTLSPW